MCSSVEKKINPFTHGKTVKTDNKITFFFFKHKDIWISVTHNEYIMYFTREQKNKISILSSSCSVEAVLQSACINIKQKALPKVC